MKPIKAVSITLGVCLTFYGTAIGQPTDNGQNARNYMLEAAECNNAEDSACLRGYAEYNNCLLRHKSNTQACKKPECTPICQETVGGVVNGRKLTPAPPLGWMEWTPMKGSSGCSVQIFFSRSNDDGRNDFEVKFKIVNSTDHQVEVRFDAQVKSAKQEIKTYKDRWARIKAASWAEADPFHPILNIAAPFTSAVNQVIPTQITDLEAVNIEVANLDRPITKISGAYLSAFRDYEKQACGRQTMDLEDNSPRFVRSTRQCATGLPSWTKPACDDATDELFDMYKVASGEDKACISEWRKYQLCYGPYAYGPSPRPVPECAAPTCIPHVK